MILLCDPKVNEVYYFFVKYEKVNILISICVAVSPFGQAPIGQ